MTQMEALKQRIVQHIPGSVVSLDPPEKPNGPWFLDVRDGEHAVIVEWRPSMGFGVSTRGGGYGEGPDEFYDDVGDALARVVQLLQTGEQTRAPDPLVLRRLREARGISQVELAELMGVRQATISKLEHRADLNLSTLRRFIRALGGELEIRARFPERVVAIGIGEPEV